MDARAGSDLPLQGMLGEGPPEHGLRGNTLVLLVYGCGAWVFAVSLKADGPPGARWSAALLGLMAFAIAAYVAGGLRRFRGWAWFFVVGWLVLLCPLFLLAPYDLPWSTPVSYLAGVTMAASIHYLWIRRGDFWLDARIAALQRRPRWVTSEWRAARLARIGAGLPSLRVPAPTAGALWMRRSARGG